MSSELATAGFNETERKVAELIIKGYSGKEIGDMLFYSYNYIKKVLASMREKCGCETLGDLKKYLCGSFEQKNKAAPSQGYVRCALG
ncbi:MAG: helix-turn-helix transcriptional regulator [Oscillospiraceae bacterium]